MCPQGKTGSRHLGLDIGTSADDSRPKVTTASVGAIARNRLAIPAIAAISNSKLAWSRFPLHLVVMIILSNGLMVLTFVAAASAPLSHFVHLNFFPALLARHPRFNCHDAAAIVDCVAMVARPAEMVS